MTEEEWRACEKPAPMLAFLRGKIPARKFRLFVCGCCRRSLWVMSVVGGQGAVEACELWADGLRSERDVQGRIAAIEIQPNDPDSDPSVIPLFFALGFGDPHIATALALTWINNWPSSAVDAWCANALRCLAGRPFPRPEAPPPARPRNWLATAASGVLKMFASSPMRPDTPQPVPSRSESATVTPVPAALADPSWLTSDVLALAHGMYESRDFSAMPILADALQDAGCDSNDILSHCRSEGPHVRGCWVVDILFGKG